MRVRTAWEDHFPSTSTTTFNSQTYTSRQTPSNTSVYVSNCLFRFITSSDNGGALCSTSITYLLIESTSFFSCKTSSSNGGAIYFQNSGSGQCVLHEVCGYDCCSTYTSSYSDYQFAYIEVNNAASSKNYFNYSSIVRCMSESSRSRYMFHLINGKICCPSINISLNKCYHLSAITCGPFSDPNSITSSWTFSSFADNIATEFTCFWLRTEGANYEIKSCNILRNTQGNPSHQGTFCIAGNLMIEHSCILGNNANYLYCAGSATLSNCTIDKTTSYTNPTIENTVIKSFILALNHMSNILCYAEYDAFSYLTAITPHPPSHTKQIHLCTCGIIFPEPKLIDVISLNSILFFNFIHPYTSDDPY
jgi:hypothetical protein